MSRTHTWLVQFTFVFRLTYSIDWQNQWSKHSANKSLSMESLCMIVSKRTFNLTEIPLLSRPMLCYIGIHCTKAKRTLQQTTNQTWMTDHSLQFHPYDEQSYLIYCMLICITLQSSHPLFRKFTKFIYGFCFETAETIS